MKKRIFISYSRTDEAFAEDLEKRLRDLGRYDVRRDRRVLAAGEDWWRGLQEEIEAADTLVLCVSDTALQSDNVRAEWLYAKQVGTRVMPVAAEAISYAALPKWLARVNVPQFQYDAAGLREAWAGFTTVLDTPYIPHYAPFMADPPPPDFVGRPKEYAGLKRALLDETGSVVGITGVVGGGGFGKTTLAQALCRDKDIRDWFYDGILWLTSSEKATEDSMLAGARDLIKRMTNKDATETTRDGIKAALRDAISDRYVLIVLDDVWSSIYRVIFANSGDNARILITTRNPNLLPREAQSTQVDAMEKAEAHILLRHELPDGHNAELDKLAKKLGYWALLLKLANGQLHRRIKYGEPFEAAITWVFQALEAEGFDAVTAPDDPNARNRAASASLGVSIGMLDKIDRERFEMLAIFPEDTVVPLRILEELWNCSKLNVEKICKNLFELSLLLSYDLKERTIRLHDVVRTYLRDIHRESIPEWNRQFLNAFKITDWSALPQTETYLWYHLALHLRESGQVDTLHGLLTDFRWLQAKLDATYGTALMADFDALANDETSHLIQSAVRLSLGVLAANPRLLASQLTGRLFIYHEKPDIAKLIRSIIHPVGTFKYFGRDFPGHIQAGGTLIRTLEGHTDVVNGALALDDGRFLSWSDDMTLRLWDAEGALLDVLEVDDDIATGIIRRRRRREIGRRVLALSGKELFSYSEDKRLPNRSADKTLLIVLNDDGMRVEDALMLTDGRLFSWSDDGTLWLRDTDGKALTVLEGHSGKVIGVRILDDGRLLSWSDDGKLWLWDADGKALATLEGHTDSVEDVLILDDGRFLSWASDNILRLWDTDGKALAKLEGHTDSIKGVLELSNRRLLSWADDKALRLWDMNGKGLAVLEGHTNSVGGVLELSNRRLLSWADDKTLRLWDVDETALTIPKSNSKKIKGMEMLDTGRLLSWSDDEMLSLWNTDGSLLASLEGHTYSVEGVLILDDNRFLSWAGDNILRLWDTDGKPLATLEGHTRAIRGVLVLDNGRFLSWSYDTLRLWDADGKPLATLEGHTDTIRGVLVLDNGRFLSWSHDTLWLWDADGKPLATLEGHTDTIRGVLVLDNGRLLSWAADNSIRLWNADGKLLRVVEKVFTNRVISRHGLYVRALNNGRFLSWGQDNILRLWGADGQLTILDDHTGQIEDVLMLANGRLLSWAQDNTLRLWNLDGTALAVLRGHTKSVENVRILEGGRLISWASDDTLRLWDTDGKALATLEGHTGWIDDVLTLANGRLLSWVKYRPSYLWEDGGLMRLWDADGMLISILEGHTDQIEKVLALSDGCILSWSTDRTLRLWDVDGKPLSVFYCDSSITCCNVLSEAPLRVAVGDDTGRVIFLQLVEEG